VASERKKGTYKFPRLRRRRIRNRRLLLADVVLYEKGEGTSLGVGNIVQHGKRDSKLHREKRQTQIKVPY